MLYILMHVKILKMDWICLMGQVNFPGDSSKRFVFHVLFLQHSLTFENFLENIVKFWRALLQKLPIFQRAAFSTLVNVELILFGIPGCLTTLIGRSYVFCCQIWGCGLTPTILMGSGLMVSLQCYIIQEDLDRVFPVWRVWSAF